MRLIGFSTGALALGDFSAALTMLKNINTRVIELSALRDHEVEPLMTALPSLDLSSYSYVSIHVPSKFSEFAEAQVAGSLRPCIDREIPIVIHPDVIKDRTCWKRFGSLLCIENMDKRKRTGRTAKELEEFFEDFPSAGFCLDIAHARQIDSTMGQAREMLSRFGARLRQIHISELDGQGHHHGLSLASILASSDIAELIPLEIPIIIEAQVSQAEIQREIELVGHALTPTTRRANKVTADWGALA